MKSLETLLADFRHGAKIRFLMHSPAQRLQYRQFVARLVQENLSYEVAYNTTTGELLVYQC